MDSDDERDSAPFSTCFACGRVEPGARPPLTWMATVERGQQRWVCDECSRKYSRSIEARLDSEWW